jgi:hypothetical protein
MDMNHHSSDEKRTTSIAVIAIVAALALFGVVVVTVAVTIPLQEVEAGCERGKAVSIAFNASKGRCFLPPG